MSWQPPPPPPPSSFPEPFGTPRSADPSQYAAGHSAYRQAGPPPGHTHPSQIYNSGVPSSQQYPSQLPHPSRRSTIGPTYDYASSYSSAHAPTPTSGSASHYTTYPDSARYASTNSSSMSPHMMQRTVSMPVPGHQYSTRSMPHDGSLPNTTYPPSHSGMSGWPQPTSQGWSDPYANEEGGDWSSDEEFEQSPEGASHLQKKSPPGHPIGWRKKPRKKQGNSPDKSFSSGSTLPTKVPCRYCRRMSPREIVESLGGFCCVEHRHQWIAEHQ